MIINKIIIAIFVMVFLNGCVQSSVFLGPVITVASTGNIYQGGLSYGSGRIINNITGKSTSEYIIEILKPRDGDKELKKLVKKRIKNTRKKLNLTN